MPAAAAFPAIDLTGVTENPLIDTLKKGPETPVFNEILRRKRRTVSQLRNARWPEATTVEPETPETDDPESPAPEVTPKPETSPAPDPTDPAPAAPPQE